MQIAPTPMEAFQMGTARGGANSPVTGIGMAIQNIVDDARKKGLLKAQSMYQAEGADQNAILKEQREEDRRSLPQTTTFFDPSAEEGSQITDVVGTRGGGPAKAVPRAPLSIADMIRDLKEFNEENVGNGDSGTNTSDLSIKATKWLEENGGAVTPDNIQAVINAGKVR